MTRKKCGPASRWANGPWDRSVRVADSETWVSEAASYVGLEAATAPEVDGPRMATTDLSETYFCASATAGAGPCSTGVSPWTSLTLRPCCCGSVATAYCAQESCSWPRMAAPPVSGVTIAMVRADLQLTPAAARLEWADAAVEATSADTPTTAASATPTAFIRSLLLRL